VNNLLRKEKKQPAKKIPNIYSSSIFFKNCGKGTFQKNDLHQKHFLEDLGLLVIKIHFPL
jgi:hypothetical protein